MNQAHPHRATIAPVPEGEARPLWSVMIPTYNCAHYLRETLASVLQQDPGAAIMQIVVVDDCSTQDDPELVVKEMGGDRVQFYRQSQNIGHIHNFETCLQQARGHLIHILHGDDVVRQGFYNKLQQAFTQSPEVGAAYCRHLFMDEEGHWERISPLEQRESGILDRALERFVIRHPVQTPAIVVRRDVYEQLGGFDHRLSCCEDWEMWVRIAAQYPIWYEVEPLAIYRGRANSLSRQVARTGQDLRDISQIYEMIQAYLPPETAKALTSQSREFWAFTGLHKARQMLATGDFAGATAQMQQVFRFSVSPNVLLTSLFYLSITLVKYFARQMDVDQMFISSKSAETTNL